MAEPIWKRGANAGEIRVVESIDRAIQLYERWIAEERAVRRRILAACRRRAKREGDPGWIARIGYCQWHEAPNPPRSGRLDSMG